MNRDIHTSVSDIIKKLDIDSEFDSLRNSFEYFKFRYPAVVDEFSNEFEKIKDKKKWNAFLREIRFWSELGVEQMTKRLLQLSLRYLPKGERFFRIENEIGSFTLPTRLDMLNKISLLTEELIYDIFPRIEDHLNFKAESKIDSLPIVKGTIDWTGTILRSINRGEKFPMQFSCITSETKFDTPENILAMFCLFKLQNEINGILYLKGQQNLDLNYKEINVLSQLKQQIDNIVTRSHLRDIEEKISQYVYLSIDSKFVSNLKNKTRERIQQGVIRQKSYNDLLDWLEEFKGYNIRAISENYANFPIDHEKSIDTVFELWIIFEMIRFFIERKNVKLLQINKSNENNLAGFKLQLDNTTFNLNYQKKVPGWTDLQSQPDFSIQIEGNDDIPIVMDPKNWSAKTGEAGHKMLGYLNNLSSYNTRIGILFYSDPKRTQFDNADSYNEKKREIGGITHTFVTMVMNPNFSDKMEANLEHVFQYVKTVIHV